jgi:hypothetical protein
MHLDKLEMMADNDEEDSSFKNDIDTDESIKN